MDLGLSGRVAIVTGSSRGIGRACAESLLREGASVVVTGRDKARLDKACEDMSTLGGKVLGVQVDLASDEQTKAMADRAIEAFGQIDILVNSAAAVRPADFFEITEANWGGVFEEKLNGYVRALRHVVPHMKARRSGRIVNMSGAAARQPHYATVTVGLNNAAVLNLTKSLAAELARHGIAVNAVLPHIIDTDTQDDTMRDWAAMTGQTEAEVRAERVAKVPVGRMGKPQEVGDVVAFLASERASFVCGAALHVDGGVIMGV